ncbi:APC family permease [Adhaeribacter radiodurans]|uniref:APC family permease n=1 Tax=Adhaeribacter radiodurans TaxID=2745197 RepID=A0A7L7LB28_9BACT|nr:APC family permease [Adhaeribacter radiodurans]QMU30046.1 APC family permease [Adhaeribacter radiodurans]
MDKATDIDKRLLELGHPQGLRRRLHIWHVVGLALALMSPTVAVFLLATAVFSVGGTFTIGANIIINLIAIPLTLIIAELGALYPVTGGIYSLARRILPGPIMWMVGFNILVMGVIFLAVSSLGIAPFLKNLLPGFRVPDQLIAILMLLIATSIALIKVELGAIINAVLIVVECIALGTIIVAGFSHPHQSVPDILLQPTRLQSGHLTPVTTGFLLATLPAAFSMITAPELVLGYSEELIGNTKTLAKAVLISSFLGIPLILIPLTAAVVAAPNLVAFLQSPTPVIYSIQQAFGNETATFINVCICVALFTAMIGALMYFPRLLYAMGRDGMWGSGFTHQISTLNRYSVPGVAIVVIAFVSLLLIFVSALNWLVIFLGTCVTTIYFFVGLMGLWSRFKSPQELRPYRMPVWPICPIIVMLFTAFVLTSQDSQYLIGFLILNTAAVLAGAIKNKYSTSS